MADDTQTAEETKRDELNLPPIGMPLRIGEPQANTPAIPSPIVAAGTPTAPTGAPNAPAMPLMNAPAVQIPQFQAPTPQKSATQRLFERAGQVQNPFARILAQTGAGILRGADLAGESLAPRLAMTVPGSEVNTDIGNRNRLGQAMKTYEDQLKPAMETQAEQARFQQDTFNQNQQNQRERERLDAETARQQTAEAASEKARQDAETAAATRQQTSEAASEKGRQESEADADRRQEREIAAANARQDKELANKPAPESPFQRALSENAAKDVATANGADFRWRSMSDSYPKALKGDQQAMVNLLTNHIGMTLGLQKGTRITKDILHEAQNSTPMLARIKAKFDDRGYLSGVTLSPDQMGQMMDLAKTQRVDAWQQVSDSAGQAGVADQVKYPDDLRGQFSPNAEPARPDNVPKDWTFNANGPKGAGWYKPTKKK